MFTDNQEFSVSTDDIEELKEVLKLYIRINDGKIPNMYTKCDKFLIFGFSYKVADFNNTSCCDFSKIVPNGWLPLLFPTNIDILTDIITNTFKSYKKSDCINYYSDFSDGSTNLGYLVSSPESAMNEEIYEIDKIYESYPMIIQPYITFYHK